jgi:hypothetical protein
MRVGGRDINPWPFNSSSRSTCPVLMITHAVAFYLLLRPQPKAVRAFAGDAAAS